MKRRLDPTPPAIVGLPTPAAPDDGTPLPPSRSGGPKSTFASPRSRDRLYGLIIVAVSFVICLAVSIWAKERSRPETSEPPGPPTLDGLSGFPSAVDPVASLAVARKLTKRPSLRGIVIDGVQSDGTLDLSEGPGRVRYAFQSPAGHGAQPPREPGTLPRRITCGKQNVVLRREGLVAEPDLADYPCAPSPVEPLPEPQCSAKDLWRLAKKRRVPKDRMAHIEYFRAKAGPAWRFEISGTPHRFTVYGDCKRELTGADAQGTVP
jgi:hypothetical protein